jgi:thiol:disulfide interchange protein DsbD
MILGKHFCKTAQNAFSVRLRWWMILLTVHAVTVAASGQETEDIAVNSRIVQHPTEAQPLIVEVELQIPPGYYVYSSPDHFFRLQTENLLNLNEPAIAKPSTVLIPDLLSDVPGAQTPVYKDNAVFRLTFQPEAGAGTPWTVQGQLRYQACSDVLCLPPESVSFEHAGSIGTTAAATSSGETIASEETGQTTALAPAAWQPLAAEFVVAGRLTGYAAPDKFLTFLRRRDPASTAWSALEQLAEKSLLFWIVAVLIGGLALNLTPCVLPMIPVNLAIIGAGTKAQSRARGFALGSSYGAGVAIAYGALGLVVILTGSTFGAVNASPWFNLSLAIIFLLLALAMAGVFNLDLSTLGSKLNTGRWRQGSYALAFVIGMVTALAAGACVAPVVIFVLVQASQQYGDGNTWALLYPFVLGIGMALPWPIAGAGLSLLPKPGRWMSAVKYLFALFIFLLAIYYGQLGMRQVLNRLEPAPAAEASAAAGGLNWHTSLAAALTTARAEQKPLFIDFWATWCKNCHVMDRTTFRDPEVIMELRDYVLLKYQAEDTGDPATAAVLQHFEVLGLPTYLILTSQTGVVQ